MPSTNILLFDENKQNLMSDVDYSSDARRSDGLQSGVASSSLQNKFQLQVSLFARALAEIMLNNGYDALDTDLSTTFINNLSSSIIQPNQIPDLQFGVEYRTIEKLNGNTVYCKVINTGAITGETTEVLHGITNLDKLTYIECFVDVTISGENRKSTLNQYFQHVDQVAGNSHPSSYAIYISGQNLVIKRPYYYEGTVNDSYVVLKYTKTT